VNINPERFTQLALSVLLVLVLVLVLELCSAQTAPRKMTIEDDEEDDFKTVGKVIERSGRFLQDAWDL
jgi:hypothetical protein